MAPHAASAAVAGNPKMSMSRILVNREDTEPSAHSFATNFGRTMVEMLVGRAEDKDCSPQPGVNLCEKPGMSTTTVTWIIVGSVLGGMVVVTLSVLIMLHFRRRRQDKREDLNDRYQMSDYGLDELPGSRKPRPDDDAQWSQDGSSTGYGRRSREPLQAGSEPKYHGGRSNGHLNPFDDGRSITSGNGSSYPPSVDHQWPKRDNSHPRVAAQGR